MELALEVNFADNSISLIDSSLCTQTMPQITKSDIDVISDHFSDYPVFKDIILDLTQNQTIVILYFLLHRTIFPPSIISGYLYDVGICTDQSDRLGRLIYDLKSDILDQDEFDFSKLIRNKSFNHNPGTDKSSDGKFYDLNTLFNSLDRNEYYYWKFDSIQRNNSTDKRDVNLSQIKETLFEVEDKKHIIIGLSVPFTSLLRNIASENIQLLNELSRCVAIGYRDKTSIAGALSDHPEILTILINYGFKSLEYYGITEGRKWIQMHEGIFNKSEVNARLQSFCIPLFIKILK